MKTGIESNRGMASVEFALILPLFFLLILGIVEFGRYFFIQHTLQFATREGVRLALVGGTLANPQGGGNLTRAQSIVTEIQQNAITILPAQLSISIFPIQANYTNPQGWQGQQNAGSPGDYMRVVTQYPFQFLTPMIGSFFPGGTLTMQAEATYRNELFN